MSMISQDEVAFHSTSGADWNGRLFEWNGDIYRAIGQCYMDVLQRMFHEGILEKLIEKGLLVQTEAVSLQLDGYPLVVKHRRLPFVSYPGEWILSMMKDVALLVVDLEIELAQFGLSIHDTNPWNVLFDWTKPVFVDLGAIMPIENDSIWSAAGRNALWPAYNQFCQFILYPLYLMSWGYGRIARSLLSDYKGVMKEEFLKLAPAHPNNITRKIVYRAFHMAKRCVPSSIKLAVKNRLLPKQPSALAPNLASRLKFLHHCRQEIENIRVGSSESYWSRYYRDFHGEKIPLFTTRDGWTVKNHNVFKVLNSLRPQSVLDIGCNTGWYAQLAARHGHHVIAFDTDEICVDHLYLNAKSNNLTILPLLMDFRSPSPACGPCYRWLLPATERLQCDLVLALASIHHLVSKQYLTFEQIAQTLSLFSKKWVLVEFIPPDDEYVRDWLTENFSWYTMDNFIRNLQKYFPYRIEVLDSYPSPRKLLLCEK